MNRALIISLIALIMSGCTIDGFEQNEDLTVIECKKADSSCLFKYQYKIHREIVPDIYLRSDSTYHIGQKLTIKPK